MVSGERNVAASFAVCFCIFVVYGLCCSKPLLVLFFVGDCLLLAVCFVSSRCL